MGASNSSTSYVFQLCWGHKQTRDWKNQVFGQEFVAKRKQGVNDKDFLYCFNMEATQPFEFLGGTWLQVHRLEMKQLNSGRICPQLPPAVQFSLSIYNS